MLKGIQQSKRDIRWHKRHKKRLLKDEKRRKRGRVGMTKAQMSRAEAQFKEAQEREKKKKITKWQVRRHKLWLWFISLKPVVWVRKVAHWWSERQYKG